MKNRFSDWPVRHKDATVLIVAVVVLLATLPLVIRVLPAWLANTKGMSLGAKSQEIGRVRTATLAFLAGGIALIGAVYTAFNYRLGQRAQITDRYIRATSQLGDTSLSVRIGGIFGLERIARESEVEHSAVMEVLTAYIRETTRGSSAAQAALPIASLPGDVQAAFTVIERRTRRFDTPDSELDLTRVDLSHLKLHPNADLRGINLAGAKLVSAYMPGANLRGAKLGGVDFSSARLEGAKLDGAELLTGPRLSVHHE